MFKFLSLKTPEVYGIPRDQALFLAGGESNNPRDYDPATSHGDDLLYSGLVMLGLQFEVLPDLAESWEISSGGKIYTFHLRKNARFHNGRPVTAQDIIYSWERAADPATNSDTVLTYLGDIVGLADKRAGKAKTISGLKAINDRTLQVTIDAPKPYFLMKLTYGTSSVLDRANVESGPEWYKRPNGTGPYKLIRWDPAKAQLYERNSDFYLRPPAIPYIVIQMYTGVPIRLYETGDVDMAGVASYDVERFRDPKEPLHADLREGVTMCTAKITFDVKQPPFDDPKVRQAFALSVDRQRLVDLIMDGVGIVAHGLYPPALPGYDSDFKGLEFDPQLARQRLAESRYGSAEKLPPIVFTSSGFSSDVTPSVAAVADMWQKNLGVTIQVQNVEPDKYQDELHAGRHGQLFSDGWCADYPDPENFADVLFHSGAQQNVGHYSNPSLDALLEKARIERDVTRRIEMYGQAEQIIVDDAAAIFLSHRFSFVLVKPHVKGYTFTPIDVPLYRYLSLDPSMMK
jgi:oligopeptide transport system substrate-binding protein